MNGSVSVLSKLFVMGEYSILKGGSAVLAALEPRHTYFLGDTSLPSHPLAYVPHPESPLARWREAFSANIDPTRIPQPWHGSIAMPAFQGMGSSTAELAAAWSAQPVPANPAGLVAWYRSQFPRQSGADLAVQLQALAEGPGLYEVKPEPEAEGAFQISRLKTGRALEHVWVLKAAPERKVATHESLKRHASVGFDAFKLEFFHEKLRRLLAEDVTRREWKLLNDWAEEIASHGLETEYAREVRSGLAARPDVFGVKGCGAGLNDVFLVAASVEFDPRTLDEVCARHGLRRWGTLAELLEDSEVDPVRAFAPVNIAWIKYMGKVDGRPTNSSYSITLDSIGTLTEIRTSQKRTRPFLQKKTRPFLPKRVGSFFEERVGSFSVEFEWGGVGYVPPGAGQEKVERWLRDERIWVPMLNELGYEAQLPDGKVRITSFNSAPAATGIATSASGFAALALAWSASLIPDPLRRQEWIARYSAPTAEGARIRAALAQAASRGSGSAGRSIEGPWVEWSLEPTSAPSNGTSTGTSTDAATEISSDSPAEFRERFIAHDWDADWIDFVLLLEREPKRVTSSQAHERVKTSPLFESRQSQLHTRIAEWRQALQSRTVAKLRDLTLAETLEMHELFHTSEPPFTYLNDASKRWIELARNPDSAVPSKDYVVTLDAGANLHWFVRPKELKLWRTWFKYKDPKLEWIEGRVGKGARYA